MKTATVVGLVLVSFMLLACKPTLDGSGELVVEDLKLSGFEQVRASQAFPVEITRAESFSVQVHIDDNLAEHLRVEVVGKRLEIGMNPEYNYRTDKKSMVAEITMPQLTGVRLSGASRARLTGFTTGEPLEIDLSGASGLSGHIECGKLELDLSGASELNLTGTAERANLELSGASDADLDDFNIGNAEADLSGASKAVIKVAGRLDVEASGASSLTYLGQPDLGRVETSGTSSVHAR